jgi:hypothetical protein
MAAYVTRTNPQLRASPLLGGGENSGRSGADELRLTDPRLPGEGGDGDGDGSPAFGGLQFSYLFLFLFFFCFFFVFFCGVFKLCSHYLSSVRFYGTQSAHHTKC